MKNYTKLITNKIMEKYKWIQELIEKEFPDIKISADVWNYGMNTSLCLQVTLSNGEPMRQIFDIRYARYETPEGYLINPQSCIISVDGDTDYYIPSDWKPNHFDIVEDDTNKAFIRDKCKGLLMWQKWSEGALVYKKEQLQKKNLPCDKVNLGPTT